MVKNFVFAASLSMFCASSFAWADVNPRDWQYFRTLQSPSPVGEPYLALTLDPPVFDHSQSSLADLRIVDGDEAEVPYKLIVSRSQTSSVRLSPRMSDIQAARGVTSFILDMGPGLHRHNSVTLRTDSKDFRAAVKIQASEDTRGWGTIREDGVVFDVSADYKASHLSASYPASTRRYLLVSLKTENGAPLRIQGAEVSHENVMEAAESQWSGVKMSRSEEGKTSVWEVDLGFDNVPVSRLAVMTGNANFQRPVRMVALEKNASGIETKSVLASGVIWRFRLPAVSNESLSVQGTGFSRRRFRIEIDNGDNPPLDIREMMFFGPKHTLYFPSQRAQPYKLYFGNPEAGSPVYDLAAFSGYLDLSKAPLAVFSEAGAQANPRYAKIDKRPWTEQHRGLFWAALLATCGFLLFLIMQKTREILA